MAPFRLKTMQLKQNIGNWNCTRFCKTILNQPIRLASHPDQDGPQLVSPPDLVKSAQNPSKTSQKQQTILDRFKHFFYSSLTVQLHNTM